MAQARSASAGSSLRAHMRIQMYVEPHTDLQRMLAAAYQYHPLSTTVSYPSHEGGVPEVALSFHSIQEAEEATAGLSRYSGVWVVPESTVYCAARLRPMSGSVQPMNATMKAASRTLGAYGMNVLHTSNGFVWFQGAVSDVEEVCGVWLEEKDGTYKMKGEPQFAGTLGAYLTGLSLSRHHTRKAQQPANPVMPF